MIKKFILLTLAGTIAYFVFGWLVFEALLGAYTTENTTQLSGFKKNAEQFSMSFLLLSCAAYAALIVYIITVQVRTTKLWHGTRIAAIIGVLVAIMTDSYWFASSNFYNSLYVVIADVLAAGVTVGFLGFVVTFLSNKLSDN